MAPIEQVEIENKFEVEPETPLPPEEAFSPLTASSPRIQELSAVYFDTEDLSLTRHKVTLRRRTGGEDEGWHLKLPASTGRQEIRLPFGNEGPLGEAESVPAELRNAVAALIRRRPLISIAQIDNTRRVIVLSAANGSPIVELCDDRVRTKSFVDPKSGGGSWHEWEAELVDSTLPGGPDALDAVTKVLTSAGARISSSPSKLARALGPLPEPPTPITSPVQASLLTDLEQLLDHDPGARRGTVVGVHQMRVAVRGMRSTISSFASELADETAGSTLDLPTVLAELKVLAAVLGKVRDLQVVAERLERLYEECGTELVPLVARERIATELGHEEHRAQQRVVKALCSDRYLDLVDQLHELTQFAGVGTANDKAKSAVPAQSAPGSSVAAQGSTDVEVLLRGVDRQFAKFTKVRTRTERDLDTLELTLAQREELTHGVRKRAKALRRNVAALPASEGLKIAPLRTACQRLHSVLGEVQDSVTTRVWLLRFARRAEAYGESSFGFGVLYERERGFAERTLEGFESDAATVSAAFRELSESRRASRKRKGRKKKR